MMGWELLGVLVILDVVSGALLVGNGGGVLGMWWLMISITIKWCQRRRG